MSLTQYLALPSVTEALKVLDSEPSARIIAGGTDLMIKIRKGIEKPGTLVDIKGINRMKGIRIDDDGSLWIGPLTTHSQICESTLVLEKYPFLADAARNVGSKQIRNRGTIGGNICNGSPAAETLPLLYCLGAILHIESYKGERTVPIGEFCKGPQKTCLCHSEMLTAIQIPPIKGEYDGVYLRHSRRRAVDIAMVTCAAMWVEDKTLPTGRRYRIALGSVAPTVVRAHKGEEYLNTLSACSEDSIEEAAMITLSDISPIDDIRTTCDYRRDVVFALVKRAVSRLVCSKGGM